MNYQPIALDTAKQYQIACYYDTTCRGQGSYYAAEQLREWSMTMQDGRYNFEDYAAYIYAEYGICLDH